MRPLSEQIELRARALLPALVAILLCLVSVLPLPVPGTSGAGLSLLLAAVFYWSAMRPALMPPGLVFAVGLFYDLIAGLPPGLSPLLLLAVRLSVPGMARFLAGASFSALWAVFAAVAMAYGAGEWLVTAISRFAMPPADPVLVRVVLMIIAYPLLSALLFEPADRLAAQG